MMITDSSSITAALLCVLQLISASPPQQQQQQQQQHQTQKQCGLYGQAPCTFVPAQPGMMPKCASPGKTFCEQNLEYPAHLIQHLVEQLGYHRILANEERVDFNAHSEWEQDQHHHHYQHFYGPSMPTSSYGPQPSSSSHNSPAPYQGYNYDLPKQQQQHYQQDDNTVAYDQKPPPVPVPQPIYIPKPQYSFNYHTYVRPPVTQRSQTSSTSSSGYFYPPPVTQFSPAEWLKRFARDLTEKQNPANGFSYHRVAGPQQGTHPSPSPFKLPPQLEVKPAPFRPVAALLNETAYHEAVTRSRQKRQVTAGRIELCQTREMYVTPQAALNTKGNWMYVVNHEDSRQLVKAEICTSTECSNLCSLPNGYNSRCEQKFSQKRLLTLDADGQSLYVDTYWFPSCCVCSLAMSN
ncbi:protein spaetzle 5-like [Ochlerotatus camptorhynchus]|uniref:protein spaetzle 5-like n=1 Tax=Ochlerotatus camptorhynchus TaxID=644619 RepID=UPI0031D5C734